jgi:ActR/RegA family two-component response regulator
MCAFADEHLRYRITEGGTVMNVMQETIRHGPAIPPNILVMEDELSVAKGLEMVLTEEGYIVDLAMNGKDALDIFDQKTFDLLVADLRLPDINGMEVIRSVKAKKPDTGVVVITGYASVNSAVDAMKLGSFDYLPKPFTDDEIKTAVEGALKGQLSVPSNAVIERVEKKEEETLIQKEEVIKVLDRTIVDEEFWGALMEQGSSQSRHRFWRFGMDQQTCGAAFQRTVGVHLQTPGAGSLVIGASIRPLKLVVPFSRRKSYGTGSRNDTRRTPNLAPDSHYGRRNERRQGA